MNILKFILNNEQYIKDLITRSTYHSNAIEGSTLTYAETYAILYNDNSFKIEGKEPREIYEAINHKKALLATIPKIQPKIKESLKSGYCNPSPKEERKVLSPSSPIKMLIAIIKT